MKVWQDPPNGLQVWQDKDGTVYVTRIGDRWLGVPAAVWDAFTAKVKRGDYDHV
jgi:hypothetical protein